MTPSGKLELNSMCHAFNLKTADAKMFPFCLLIDIDSERFGDFISKYRYFRTRIDKGLTIEFLP